MSFYWRYSCSSVDYPIKSWFYSCLHMFGSHYRLLSESGSSGSIVSGYGLEDRSIEVRSPAEAKDISSSLCVQTGSGAHPASGTMGTGTLFPGLKRDRGVTLITHRHLVPMSRMSRSYTSAPAKGPMTCSGTSLAFFI
jgi:hypothetical protein